MVIRVGSAVAVKVLCCRYPAAALGDAEDRVVAQKAVECSNAVNEARLYLSSLELSGVHTVVVNRELYRLVDEELAGRLEGNSCHLQRKSLLAVF